MPATPFADTPTITLSPPAMPVFAEPPRHAIDDIAFLRQIYIFCISRRHT
jgi:hypothetical protein